MGLFRKCRLDHDVKLYHGTRFLPIEITANRRKGAKYFVLVDGVLVKQTRSLKVAENRMTAECLKLHPKDDPPMGRTKPLEHKLVGGKLMKR